MRKLSMACLAAAACVLTAPAIACPATNYLTGDSGCNAEAIFATLKAHGIESVAHAADVEYIQSHPALKRDFYRRFNACLKRTHDCDQIVTLKPETEKIANERFTHKAGEACGFGESHDLHDPRKRDFGELFCPKDLTCDQKEHVCVLPGYHACNRTGACPAGWVCGANTCYKP